jgi:hypothetical protein
MGANDLSHEPYSILVHLEHLQESANPTPNTCFREKSRKTKVQQIP